jgi:hypothetical protein
MPHHHTATVVQRPGQQTWPSKEFRDSSGWRAVRKAPDSLMAD